MADSKLSFVIVSFKKCWNWVGKTWFTPKLITGYYCMRAHDMLHSSHTVNQISWWCKAH